MPVSPTIGRWSHGRLVEILLRVEHEVVDAERSAVTREFVVEQRGMEDADEVSGVGPEDSISALADHVRDAPTSGLPALTAIERNPAWRVLGQHCARVQEVTRFETREPPGAARIGETLFTVDQDVNEREVRLIEQPSEVKLQTAHLLGHESDRWVAVIGRQLAVGTLGEWVTECESPTALLEITQPVPCARLTICCTTTSTSSTSWR